MKKIEGGFKSYTPEIKGQMQEITTDGFIDSQTIESLTNQKKKKRKDKEMKELKPK